jgi:hypothetical protein
MSVTIERLAHPEPGLDVKHAIQSSDPQKTFFDKRTESTDFAPTKVSFGPFRLLPTEFLLLEGEKPVSISFASDSHLRLRIAPVRAVVAVAAALDSILTAFALAPASV